MNNDLTFTSTDITFNDNGLTPLNLMEGTQLTLTAAPYIPLEQLDAKGTVKLARASEFLLNMTFDIGEGRLTFGDEINLGNSFSGSFSTYGLPTASTIRITDHYFAGKLALRAGDKIVIGNAPVETSRPAEVNIDEYGVLHVFLGDVVALDDYTNLSGICIDIPPA